MNSLKKLLFILSSGIAALAFSASAQAHDAKVVKITGSAEVQLPGQTTWQALQKDALVPQGATVKTSDGAQVYLETMPGVVATIQAGSTVLIEKLNIVEQGGVVTTQEAMLDLKKGNVISTLDPTKKAINRYGVRTPKGVAAARGTVYGVSVSISGTSVATLTGSVTLNLGNGVTVSIPVGTAAVNNAETATQIAAAIADSGQTGLSVAQLLQEAVQAVAGNVAANTSAAGNANTATSVLAAVVSAAASAQPDQAANFTATAVAAASSSTSATGGSSAAVAAITEAAVRAAPAAAADISQSATKAVVETKVTEAVESAKGSGGDTTAAAAAATQSATETAKVVAQTVISTAAAVNSPVSSDTITNSVNAGVQAGASSAGQKTDVSVPPPAPVVVPPTPPSTPPSAPIVTPQVPVDLPPVSGSGA